MTHFTKILCLGLGFFATACEGAVPEKKDDGGAKKAQLIILDGWGIGDKGEGDVIANTAHTLNPVPFIYVTEKKNVTVQDGTLADVAPSILHILGLEQPVEMTGKCLLPGSPYSVGLDEDGNND